MKAVLYLFLVVVVISTIISVFFYWNQRKMTDSGCELGNQSFVICAMKGNSYVYFPNQNYFVNVSQETFSSGPVELKANLSKIANQLSPYYVCISTDIRNRDAKLNINNDDSLISYSGSDYYRNQPLFGVTLEEMGNSSLCTTQLDPNKSYIISDKGVISSNATYTEILYIFITTKNFSTPRELFENQKQLNEIFSYQGGVVNS